LIVPDDGDVILTNDRADGFITDPQIILFPNSPNEVCEVTGRWSGDLSDPLPAGCMSGDDISLMVLSYINQDFQNTTGIDFNFDWSFGRGANAWNVGLNGTYVDTYELTSEGQVF